MALENNTPTFTYCRWSGMQVTYNDVMYTVVDDYTDDKYIYWNSASPSQLTTTNVKKDVIAGEYLVFFNDRGITTIPPNSDLIIDFDGNNPDKVAGSIYAMYEDLGEIGDKFISVETEIDKFAVKVGEIEDTANETKVKVSEIEQTANNIKLEVSEITKTQTESEMRDALNKSFIDSNGTLGVFKSEMSTYMKDGTITTEEKNKITAHMTMLDKNKDEVVKQVDALIAAATSEADKTKLRSAKTAYVNNVNNLKTYVSTAISDGTIVPSEITGIITMFGNVTSSTQILKNTSDTVLNLGSGGSIVTELSRISIGVDTISLKVESTEEGVEAAVKDIDVLYYHSTSMTQLIGGSWQTTCPQWQKDKYIWTKTVTTLNSGTTNESDPVCISGRNGVDGIDGLDGLQGADGQDGVPGLNSYFHIKYSPVANPTDSQMTETPNIYIGTYVDNTKEDSTTASDYTWSKFEGIDGVDGTNGIPGTNGIDGKTSYLHIKYSDVLNPTTASQMKEDGGIFLGQYTDYIEQDSTDPSKYTWSRIRGEDGADGLDGLQGADGQDGIDGQDGQDGVSSYFHIKYSDYPNPTNSQMTEIPSIYIGTYVDNVQADSTTASDYNWSKFQGIDGVDGTDGIPGVNGTDGKTTYLHIKYSDVANPTSASQMSEDDGEYIGQYTDYIKEDSTDPSKYNWTKIKGTGVNNIVEQYYLSKSSYTQTGGDWERNPPTYVKGRYMWTRSKITYVNPPRTEYTDPVLDKSWEVAEGLDDVITRVESAEQLITPDRIVGIVKAATTVGGEPVFVETSTLEQTKDAWTATFNSGYNQGSITMNRFGIEVANTDVDTITRITSDGFTIKKVANNENIFNVSNHKLDMIGSIKTREGGSSKASVTMKDDGLNFYDGTNLVGDLMYDTTGDGVVETRNRLLLRTKNGYALKIDADADLSLGAEGGDIWLMATRTNVRGALDVSSTLTVAGTTTLNGTTNTKALNAKGTFTASTTANLNSTTTVKGSFTAKSTSYLDGTVNCGGNVNVDGALDVAGSIYGQGSCALKRGYSSTPYVGGSGTYDHLIIGSCKLVGASSLHCTTTSGSNLNVYCNQVYAKYKSMSGVVDTSEPSPASDMIYDPIESEIVPILSDNEILDNIDITPSISVAEHSEDDDSALSIDIKNIKNTRYVSQTETGQNVISIDELLKLALLEIKNLKTEVSTLKAEVDILKGV